MQSRVKHFNQQDGKKNAAHVFLPVENETVSYGIFFRPNL